MQPNSGQITSGEEPASTTPTKSGRGAHMRTIQPLNPDISKPTLVLPEEKKAQPKEILQPPISHPSSDAKPTPSPLHDTASPHPTAPMPQKTPAQTIMQPLQQGTPVQSTAQNIPPKPVNPLPKPVQSAPQAPPKTMPSELAAHPPTSTEHAQQNSNPAQHAPESVTRPVPTTPRAPAHTYSIDSNEALMRSSNPVAATLSGIELLIKRNGLVSIAYVSIFVGIAVLFLGLLYGIGRFASVETIQINFTVIAAIVIGLLLNSTYLVSFIVCVASEAGQSITLRQISYLARQSLHKLLALQILTIAATFGGLLLGIIPGIIILGRWMMAPFMIFESDHPSTLTAIKRSNKLTKGRTIEMSGLAFTQFLLLGTGLLGFAAMAAGPAARYQQLRLRLHDKTAVTKVHFLNYIMSFLLGLSLLTGMAGAGYQLYRSNQTVCYSTIKFVSGRPSPVQVCVKRHVCIRDIVCRETLPR